MESNQSNWFWTTEKAEVKWILDTRHITCSQWGSCELWLVVVDFMHDVFYLIHLTDSPFQFLLHWLHACANQTQLNSHLLIRGQFHKGSGSLQPFRMAKIVGILKFDVYIQIQAPSSFITSNCIQCVEVFEAHQLMLVPTNWSMWTTSSEINCRYPCSRPLNCLGQEKTLSAVPNKL